MWHLIRRAVVCVGAFVLGATGSAADPPIPPTVIKLTAKTVGGAVAELAKTTGWPVEIGELAAAAAFQPADRPVPFWAAVEAVAAAGAGRLQVGTGGQRFGFVRGRPTTAASLDGPFRVSVRHVLARLDAGSGAATYDLGLDVHWEPRFPVFRIDSIPVVGRVADDTGRPLSVRPVAVKATVSDFAHRSEFRIDGLTRKSTALAKLSGQFTVTAAPKMLRFAFDDLTTLPASQTVEGVTAAVTAVRQIDDVWEVTIRTDYPAGLPGFESFESWTGRNTVRLSPPDRSKTFSDDNHDETPTRTGVVMAYRFRTAVVDLTRRTGWGLVYETPAPLIEFPITFDLVDVPLP